MNLDHCNGLAHWTLKVRLLYYFPSGNSVPSSMITTQLYNFCLPDQQITGMVIWDLLIWRVLTTSVMTTQFSPAARTKLTTRKYTDDGLTRSAHPSTQYSSFSDFWSIQSPHVRSPPELFLKFLALWPMDNSGCDIQLNLKILTVDY